MWEEDLILEEYMYIYILHVKNAHNQLGEQGNVGVDSWRENFKPGHSAVNTEVNTGKLVFS